MSMTSFPVLALTILGIITAAILLVSYYIFVIKCCLNTNRYDMDRLLRARNHRHRGTYNQSLTIYPTNPIEPQGLDESTIKSIPTFTYKKLVNSDSSKFDRNMSRHECAVCLNEFQEGEKVRFLPTCSHVFHVDCIDTWLRTNANCPLCRSPVENPNYLMIPVDQLGNHVDQENNHDDIIINVEEEEEDEEALRRNNGGKMKSRKLISKDDECILELRKVEKQFSVRPIKRSFSMDSSSRRRVYEEVEKVLQRNPHFWETGIPESSGKDILPVLDFIGMENASSA